jgi:hypothetical protein
MLRLGHTASEGVSAPFLNRRLQQKAQARASNLDRAPHAPKQEWMKICLFGVSGIALGKHNIKDPRLDQADKLVEAQKRLMPGGRGGREGRNCSLRRHSSTTHPRSATC